MSGEVAAVAAEEDFDADLEAGFSGDDKATTATPGQGSGSPTEDQIVGEETKGQAAAEQPTEPPKLAQITEAQFNELMQKASAFDEMRSDTKRQLDTAFGTIGSLKQAMQQLQSATPAGVNIEVTEDLVEDLSKEFPELAKHHLAAFKKFAEKLQGTGAPAPASFNQEQINQLVQDRLAEAIPNIETSVQRSLEMRAVSRKHPDWKTVANTPEFAAWAGKQPPEYQRELGDTWDSDFLINAFDKFKESQKPAPTQSPNAAAPAARKARMEAAINPRSSGGMPPPSRTEDDDFEAGFNS